MSFPTTKFAWFLPISGSHELDSDYLSDGTIDEGVQDDPVSGSYAVSAFHALFLPSSSADAYEEVRTDVLQGVQQEVQQDASSDPSSPLSYSGLDGLVVEDLEEDAVEQDEREDAVEQDALPEAADGNDRAEGVLGAIDCDNVQPVHEEPLQEEEVHRILEILRSDKITEAAMSILEAVMCVVLGTKHLGCIEGWHDMKLDENDPARLPLAALFLRSAMRKGRTVLGMLAAIAMAFHNPDEKQPAMLRRQAVQAFVEDFPDQCRAIVELLDSLVADKYLCQPRTWSDMARGIVDIIRKTVEDMPTTAAWQRHGGALMVAATSDEYVNLATSILALLVPYMRGWVCTESVSHAECAALLSILSPRFKALQMQLWCRSKFVTWGSMLKVGDRAVLKAMDMVEVVIGSGFMRLIRKQFMDDYTDLGEGSRKVDIIDCLQNELGPLHLAHPGCASVGKRKRDDED